MYLPLILDLKDNKWSMLKEVVKFLDSRVAYQELTKRKIPVKNGIKTLKTVLTAMLFSVDVSYVKEIN